MSIVAVIDTNVWISAFLNPDGYPARIIQAGKFDLCRDPDDDVVLETAIRGKANYVVTRDQDMTRDLDLQEHLRRFDIEILTVQRFIDLLGMDKNPV